MLVNTVTASTLGGGKPSFKASSLADVAEFLIMSQPPSAWTLNMKGRILVAQTDAFATVFGMS
jgi:hypothetical protein